MAELFGMMLFVPVMFGIAILLVWVMAVVTQAPFLWLDRWHEHHYHYAPPQPQQPPTVIVLGQPQQPQQQPPAPVHNHYYLMNDGQVQPVQPSQTVPQALPQPVQPPVIIVAGRAEVQRLRSALPAPGLPRPRGE